jgi:hypothetical protein
MRPLMLGVLSKPNEIRQKNMTKSIALTVLFGIMTFPVVYCSFAFALGGGLDLSGANVITAFYKGLMYGIAVMLAIYMLCKKRKNIKAISAIIIGVVIEGIVFFVVYIMSLMAIYV